MKQLLRKTVIFLLAFSSAVYAQYNLPYPTYRSFDQMLKASNTRYPAIVRVSDPGPSGHRAYTGFFCICLQC